MSDEFIPEYEIGSDMDFLDERDPDYRIQYAQQLMQNGVWACPDDEWVDEYLDFIATWNDEELYKRIKFFHPSMYEAVRIYDCKNNEPISALVIECGALSNADRDEVRSQLGLKNRKIVDVYEKLFFDIRKKTNKSFYIMSKVLKTLVPMMQSGIQGRNQSTGFSVLKADLWRLAAWRLGWDAFKNAFTFQSAVDIQAGFTEATKVNESVKRLYTSLTEDINPFTQGEILSRSSQEEYKTKELAAKKETDKESEEGGGINRELVESLKGLGMEKLVEPISVKAQLPAEESCTIPEGEEFENS